MDEGDQFLVADVGATKTLLFLAKHHVHEPSLIKKGEYLAENFHCLEEIFIEFLKGQGHVKYAAIGACGPVTNDVCKLTNLPWMLDKKKISAMFAFERLFLINDLELEGWGIHSLNDHDLLVIQKGVKNNGNVRALLSVGTGLGEGIILEDRVLPTEGGHADFAPSTESEIGFLQWMQQRAAYVSFEKVLCGEGIENVYEFFSKKRDLKAEQIFLAEETHSKRAVSFFLQTLGKEAGNFALKTLCLGGLYLTGGVLKKNYLLIQRGEVAQNFKEKGQHKNILEQIPIYLIIGDKSVFFGGWNYLKAALKRVNNSKK